MTKLSIEPYAPPGAAPYSNLCPIVEALIARGNAPSPVRSGHVLNPLGFYEDRDGWVCDLRDLIDFAYLEREFSFPMSISLNHEANTISDRNSWIQIRGGIG
jgi:hypothetical protein